MDGFYPAFGHPQMLVREILIRWFASVPDDRRPLVVTKIPGDLEDKLPMVMVRSDRRSGDPIGQSRDDRFVRAVPVSIETFTAGVNAEDDGFQLGESCRLALHWAWRNQVSVPGFGSINKISQMTSVARVSDFATSTGIVQYASLPKSAVRHEMNLRALIRPDSGPETNMFVPNYKELSLGL